MLQSRLGIDRYRWRVNLIGLFRDAQGLLISSDLSATHQAGSANFISASGHSSDLVWDVTTMDPLSVSASIIGILGAAAKVSSVLITFVKNTKAAPKLAQTVLADVNGLSTVLSHLQTYLLGNASPTRSRASLILVEQVLVTLAECVTTFSELEDALGTSKHGAEMDALNRMKWATKESKVADIQQRLQSNKSSLTLMLTILQWFAMLFFKDHFISP